MSISSRRTGLVERRRHARMAPKVGTTLLGIARMAAAAVCAGALVGACGEEGRGESAAEELTFEGGSELFPKLDFSTGLLPPASPVQAEFSVSAKGEAKVTATAAPSGSQASPTLTGIPDKGSLSIAGGFALKGRLVVDTAELGIPVPSYDGPVPGLDDIEIAVKGDAKFDPFGIDAPTKVTADIPPTKLPPIPLPGGIPGTLVLEVAKGSVVELTFTGVCAGIDGSTATYDGRLDRAGTLVIKPVIELDIPLVDPIPLPEVSVDLSLGGSDVHMTAKVTGFGAKPAKGDHVQGGCSNHGAGSGGSGGGSGEGGGGGGRSCNHPDDCGGMPCVEGTCSPGGGICESGQTTEDPGVDECLSLNCCAELEACTYGFSDFEGCNECLGKGGGPRCSGYAACAYTCITSGVICDSGVPAPTQEDAACLTAACCDDYNACSSNGIDVDACLVCLNEGGGSGTICEDAVSCGLANCGTF
jgi:hypothetical protein